MNDDNDVIELAAALGEFVDKKGDSALIKFLGHLLMQIARDGGGELRIEGDDGEVIIETW